MAEATCSQKCEVFSRVTGYLRPVQNWNDGKQSEYKDRKTYNHKKAVATVFKKS